MSPPIFFILFFSSVAAHSLLCLFPFPHSSLPPPLPDFLLLFFRLLSSFLSLTSSHLLPPAHLSISAFLTISLPLLSLSLTLPLPFYLLLPFYSTSTFPSIPPPPPYSTTTTFSSPLLPSSPLFFQFTPSLPPLPPPLVPTPSFPFSRHNSSQFLSLSFKAYTRCSLFPSVSFSRGLRLSPSSAMLWL